MSNRNNRQTNSETKKRDEEDVIQESFDAIQEELDVRRREMPRFALYRRNFIPFFYGVSEIFPRPRKISL